MVTRMSKPALGASVAWCQRCRKILDTSRLDGSDPHRGHVNDVISVPRLYALSVWDPWAWAIDSLPAEVAKRVENRPWAPYKWVRCRRWIALHVGQAFDKDAPWRVEESSGGIAPPPHHSPEAVARSGKITAVIRIDGSREPGEAGGGNGAGRWRAMSQFGWEIGAVVKLKRAVEPGPGIHQKLWRVPIPATLEVIGQLPADMVGALAFPT